MDKITNQIIQRYTDNELRLNQLVVNAFARHHNLTVSDGLLAQYCLPSDSELSEDVKLLADNCGIEEVINIFELAIPQEEKTANGAVYTPQYIRDFIVDNIIKSTKKSLSECLCADISCGCGAFLFTLAEYIHAASGMAFVDIYHHLYGVDISAISIGRAKILLALNALLHGECVADKDFNLYCADSLLFDFKAMPGIRENKGIDIIVGNPPYVRSKNIEESAKANLAKWNTSNCGNADLYIPFFEIGLCLLSEEGHLGYITVNTFFKAVNARALRRYFADNHTNIRILNFGQELVFKKKLAYTCIVFASNERSENISYAKVSSKDIINNAKLKSNDILYSSLDHHKGWHLNDSTVLENIAKIESTGKSLGDSFVIKNGLATLANDIFIFKAEKSDSQYYYISRDGKNYRIEKDICRDIIKPNILKSEDELESKKELIIYPYDSNTSVYSETYMQEHFPCAYSYLASYKETLDMRDKGQGDYPAWYAFGRTQAINDHGIRMYFPYMSDKPHFVISEQQDLLMYCGYAIFCDDVRELKVMKRLLESDVFDYYIKNSSKPYSANYYAYAKNYVKNFGIYPMSKEQKNTLLGLRSKEEINRYVADLYQLSIV